MRTYSGVVYPAQTDAMGHMTVQFYVAAFDQAMWHLVHALGYRTDWVALRHEGWADVRHDITFSRELRAGSLFWIESSVLAIGRSSLTSIHRLLNEADELSAIDEIKSVYFDLEGRRAMELPPDIRAAATELMARTSR